MEIQLVRSLLIKKKQLARMHLTEYLQMLMSAKTEQQVERTYLEVRVKISLVEIEQHLTKKLILHPLKVVHVVIQLTMIFLLVTHLLAKLKTLKII